MQYLQFKNGDKMPALGLGTWKSAKGEIYQAIRKAIEIGYKHFDCAHIYGNEAEIGQAIADAIAAGDVKREALFITSKLWNNSHLQQHVQPAIEQTLNNLQLDYLNLYLIHWPVALQAQIGFPNSSADILSLNEIPLATTWQAMVNLKEKQLTQHIGVSNFSIAKIDDVFKKVGIMPEANQVESHPFHQQTNLFDYCKKNQIIFTAYCPLGSADRPATRILAGEPKLFENEIIKQIAAENGITMAQVMLAWAIQRGTSVIPKSVNELRLKENLEAANKTLNSKHMETLSGLNIDYRYIKGDFWCFEGSDYTVSNLWN